MGSKGGSEAAHLWSALNKMVLACRVVTVVSVKPCTKVEHGMKCNFKEIDLDSLKFY